jgi:hypothetical protein
MHCCVWAPVRDLGGRLEEVLAAPPLGGPPADRARAVSRRVVRSVLRYGLPPSFLHLPIFAADPSRPSTSRHARSLLECGLTERPDLDGQLVLGELGQAMRRAEVSEIH